MVQRRYCKANGYDADCTVIYGDTDSVMVDFHEPDCAKAMELGRAAAAEVSATFTKPIKLEFEKVSWNRPKPFLLLKAMSASRANAGMQLDQVLFGARLGHAR